MVVRSRPTAGEQGTKIGILGRAIGWTSAFALTVACGPSHPPQAEDTGGTLNQGGDSGIGLNPPEGGNASGGGGTSGIVEPLPTKIFDPEQVYVVANVKDTSKFAIAPVENPTSHVLGIDAFATYQIVDGELYYHAGTQRPLFRFRPDITNSPPLVGLSFTENFVDNDPIADTPPCAGDERPGHLQGPYDFLAGPGARFLYRCPDDARNWYENGNLLFSTADGLQLVAIGADDLLLTASPKLGVMYIGETEPRVTGGAENGRVARAHGTGFHVAGFIPLTNRLDLFEITAGGAITQIGGYAEIPEEVVGVGSTSELGPDDTLYTLGLCSNACIIRRTPAGVSEVMFTASEGTILDGVESTSFNNAAFFSSY